MIGGGVDGLALVRPIRCTLPRVVEVLTRHELLERLGRRGAARALDLGDWQRVLRGTYVAGGVDLDLRVRSQAARRVLPEQTYVADRCLLWLLGVDVLPAGPPVLEVVVPRGAVVPQRRDVRAREAAVPGEDRHLAGPSNVRSLRPLRATADLLRRLPLAEAVVVADATQRHRLVTLEGLRSELAAHAGLRGVRQAHRALDLSDARAESPPESRLRLRMVLAGLSPVPQFEVRDAAGRFLARVDLAFPESRVAIEYDGREVHERSDVFVRDRQRQNALLAAGWLVLRYTAQDLRLRPDAVVAEVLQAARRTAA